MISNMHHSLISSNDLCIKNASSSANVSVWLDSSVLVTETLAIVFLVLMIL